MKYIIRHKALGIVALFQFEIDFDYFIKNTQEWLMLETSDDCGTTWTSLSKWD